jgi:hypothetical protein
MSDTSQIAIQKEVLPMDRSERAFTEAEVRALLKRAGDLQRLEGGGETDGLSLDEIREIAARVGIEPRFVDAAAAGLGSVDRDPARFHLLGAPQVIEVVRVANRGAVSDEEWGTIVDELQRRFGALGTSDRHGHVLTWGTGDRDLMEVQVSVQSREEVTSIRITRRFEGLVGVSSIVGLFVVLATVVALFTGITLPLAVELALGGGLILVLVAVFRRLYARFVDGQRRQLDEIAARLEVGLRRPAIVGRPAATSASAADEGVETTPTATHRQQPSRTT